MSKISEVRLYRKKAHITFDRIWKSGFLHRSQAYEWLSRSLHLSREDCHIKYFDKPLCEQVINVSGKVNLKSLGYKD